MWRIKEAKQRARVLLKWNGKHILLASFLIMGYTFWIRIWGYHFKDLRIGSNILQIGNFLYKGISFLTVGWFENSQAKNVFLEMDTFAQQVKKIVFLFSGIHMFVTIVILDPLKLAYDSFILQNFRNYPHRKISFKTLFSFFRQKKLYTRFLLGALWWKLWKLVWQGACVLLWIPVFIMGMGKIFSLMPYEQRADFWQGLQNNFPVLSKYNPLPLVIGPFSLGMNLFFIALLFITIVLSLVLWFNRYYAYLWYPFILVDQVDGGIRKSLQRSKIYSKGYKSNLLLQDLSFLGWRILGIITLNGALLLVLPYAKLSLAYAYYWRKQKEEPAE